MFRGGSGGREGPPGSGAGSVGQGRTLPPHTSLIVRLAVAAGVLLVFVVVFNTFQANYADWLWFDNLGYGRIFTTVFLARLVLLLLGLAVSGLVLGWSYRLVMRNAWGPTLLPVSPHAAVWLKRAVVIGMGVTAAIIAFGFAGALAARWQTFLLFVNRVPFGVNDPQFGNDAGFYVFTMPVLHMAQGWLMGLLLITLLTTAGLYMLVFSIRGKNPEMTRPMRNQLAVTGALLMLTIAAAHLLDVFETLFSTNSVVGGTTYADVVARIPALYLLAIIAVISAVIMLLAMRVSVMRQSLRLIVAAFGLWMTAALLAGGLWPMLVQRFAVDPSALERERQYIERNIEWTRRGFALDRIRVEPYDAQNDVLARDIANNPETINNIRLWDPLPLRHVYNQVQHLRLYYRFIDVDVDRYVIDGEYRQVLLGGREIYQDGLDASAQLWVNRKLVYTHGYGVVMSPATGFTASGQPQFLVSNVPPTGALAIDQPRIYFGESFGRDASLVDPAAGDFGPVTDDMVIVNTAEPQFDRPASGGSAQPVYVESYEGSGGVRLSNFFRRILYAWHFGDINLLLNRQITSDSRVMYKRGIQERINTVAPFLLLDSDPYLVVHEGRLFWIQDAYTITDRLPYSQRQDLTVNGQRTGRDFNYIRNSVKVVMDAYNGTLDFYVLEPHGPDPLIRAYANAFPGLFKSIDEMPAELRAHMRYPEDIFIAQAAAFQNYHMTDPREFFQREDQWAIANEVTGQGQEQRERAVAPNYIIMRLPGQEELEFVLVLPFTPSERQNLTAWMGARSDGEHYGDIVVYEFPNGRAFTGPRQIEARIDNDPLISEQFALWNQSGSSVVRGDLLVIPIGESLLYAKPIYLQAESLEFPELRRVILATHDHVVMEPSLASAVRALLARQGDIPPVTPGEPGATIPPDELRRRIADLREVVSRLESVGIQLPDLEAAIRALEDLAGVPTE